MNRQRLRLSWLGCAAAGCVAIVGLHAATFSSFGTRVLGDAAGDMPGYHYATLGWAHDALRSGNWPLWNPLIFCGYPQWAEGQMGLVGPLGPLLLFLPLIASLNLWWIVLQCLTVVAAMWWLGSHRVAPVSALVGGLSIALSSSFVLRIAGGHPNLAACYPWAFFFMGAWNRWWDGRGRPMLALAGAAWSMIIWSGHLQTAYHLGIWWGVYSLAANGFGGARASWPRSLGRWALGALLAVGVGTLAAAGMALPTLELAAHSPRSALSIYESSTFNFPLENALTLLFPGCFGEGLSGSTAESGGPYLGRWYHIWENVIFLNPVILAGLVLGARRCPAGARRGLWVSALVCLLLALGRQTPLFQIAYHLVPGIKSLRCHGRLMAPVLFVLIAVGTMALDDFLRSAHVEESGKRRRVALYALSALSAIAGIVAWFGGFAWAAQTPLQGPSLELFPKIPEGASLAYSWATADAAERARVFTTAAIRGSAVWCAAFGGLAVLAHVCPRRFRRAGGIAFILLGLVVGAWWASPYQSTYDPAKDDPGAQAITAIRNAAGSGRVIMMGAGDRNLLPRHGIPVALGYAALLSEEQNTLFQIAQNHPPGTMEYQSNAWELAPQARWLGISAVVSMDGETAPAGNYPLVYTEGPIRVWQVPNPVPLAFWTGGGRSVRDGKEAAGMLRSDTRDREEVILESVENLASSTTNRTPLQATRPAPGRIDVNLEGTGAGWAVLLESNLPGWSASIDGADVPLVPAQLAFMAVKLPAGAKQLKLVYRPLSFTVGMGLSLLAAAMLLAGAILPGRGGEFHRRIPAALLGRRDRRRRERRGAVNVDAAPPPAGDTPPSRAGGARKQRKSRP